MRFLQAALRGVIVIAVMLSALTMASPQADAAVPAGPVCEDGVLVDGEQCEVEGDTDAGDVCPAIESDAGDCYRIVPTIFECPDGAIEVGGACAFVVPNVPGELTCADGFTLTEDLTCERSEGAVPNPACEDEDAILNNDGDTCVLEGPDPEPGSQVCPDDAMGEPDNCFIIVEPEAFCETGIPAGDNTCLVPVDPIPGGPFFCPDGLILTEDLTCERQEPATYVCEVGDLLPPQTCREEVPGEPGDNDCDDPNEILIIDLGCVLIVGDADFSTGEAVCPEGQIVVLGELCAILSPGGIECPDGFEPVVGEVDVTTCERFTDAFAECPADYELRPGDICALVVQVADQELICPGDEPPSAPPDCTATVPAQDRCPAGSSRNDARECEQPVDALDVDPTCPDGFELDDDRCITTSDPIIEFDCPEGVLDGVDCIIEGDAPETGPDQCPPDAGGEVDGCFFPPLEPKSELCPSGSTLNPDGCREPVENIGEGCAPDFELIDGRCLRFDEPVWLCNGVEVTINMTLGDSGIGTPGDDVILGTSRIDLIDAGPGNDLICALGGNDIVAGGPGLDIIHGMGGNDLLLGQADRDIIFGDDGNDIIIGHSGPDDLFGGRGNDLVSGRGGDDAVLGGSGNDRLAGGKGRDVLTAGSGNDRLFGGDDNDFLKAGSGIDYCNGAAGIDQFRDCESNGDPQIAVG